MLPSSNLRLIKREREIKRGNTTDSKYHSITSNNKTIITTITSITTTATTATTTVAIRLMKIASRMRAKSPTDS